MGRRIGVGLAAVGMFLACGDGGGGGGQAPPGDLTVVACGEGTRRVGTACVANRFFDDVLVPSDDGLPFVDTAPDGTRYVRSVLLVSLRDERTSLDAARQLFAKHGGEPIGAIPFAAFYMVLFSRIIDYPVLDAMREKLAAEPAVRAVNLDIEVDDGALAPERAAGTDLEKLTGAESFHDLYDAAPDAPIGVNGRWAYESVGLPRAWSALYAQNSPTEHVVVGVLDGKVERERFPNLVFAGAHDRRVRKTESSDSSAIRHGTAVASIIAGPDGDGGMTGYLGGLSCLRHDLAPTAVLEQADTELSREEKRLRTDAIFWGIVYAVQAGARVVNMSLAHTGTGDWRFNLARNYRLVMGAAPDTLFVMGAGNDDADASFYIPCSAARLDEESRIDNAICVGAIDEAGARASWGVDARTGRPASSNYDAVHETVAIAAPGTRVLATLPDGRLTMFLGTSAATPMVSGAAALLFGVLPGLDGALAKKLLLDSATPLGDRTLGGKRLDAAAAVDKALALAAELHPERVGAGDCRAPDVDASAGSSSACAAGSSASCFFCGPADYAATFPARPDNDRSGTSEPSRTFASFTWENPTTLKALTLEVFSFEGSLRIALPNPSFDPPVVKGDQRPGSLDVQATGPYLGVIRPKLDQTFTDDAGVVRSYTEVIKAFELKMSEAGGKLTGTVTAHGDLGGTFTATMKDVTHRPSGGCE